MGSAQTWARGQDTHGPPSGARGTVQAEGKRGGFPAPRRLDFGLVFVFVKLTGSVGPWGAGSRQESSLGTRGPVGAGRGEGPGGRLARFLAQRKPSW